MKGVLLIDNSKHAARNGHQLIRDSASFFFCSALLLVYFAYSPIDVVLWLCILLVICCLRSLTRYWYIVLMRILFYIYYDLFTNRTPRRLFLQTTVVPQHDHNFRAETDKVK